MSGAETIVRNPLTTLQRKTVDIIKTRLPMLQACEPHPGRFTPEELNTIRTRSPAVHVGLPAVRGVEAVGGGMVRASVKTVAVVITKDGVYEATDTAPKRKYAKEEAALALVSSLLIALPDAGLGAGVQSCEDVAADNLTSARVSKDGVAMWGLHWTNTLTIQDPEEEGVTLASLFYSWTPEIGIPHEPDYVEIGGGVS